MTKTNRRTARPLTSTVLAAARGGYTITLSYDLSRYLSTTTTLENISKTHDDVVVNSIDNTK